jgi:hypothetical protein
VPVLVRVSPRLTSRDAAVAAGGEPGDGPLYRGRRWRYSSARLGRRRGGQRPAGVLRVDGEDVPGPMRWIQASGAYSRRTASPALRLQPVGGRRLATHRERAASPKALAGTPSANSARDGLTAVRPLWMTIFAGSVQRRAPVLRGLVSFAVSCPGGV